MVREAGVTVDSGEHTAGQRGLLPTRLLLGTRTGGTRFLELLPSIQKAAASV